jgi:hypothetical protein
VSHQEHRVSVDNGKYTFVVPAGDFRVSILRNGEPWHGPQAEACTALCAIMAELDARVVVAEARLSLEYRSEGLMPSGGLERALERHGRLVGDIEPPSEWATSVHR